MEKYYVNKHAQSNGDHEVHREDCYYLPTQSNRIHIGIHSNCEDAVAEAKRTYARSNGCKTCSSDCHTNNKKDLIFQK